MSLTTLDVSCDTINQHFLTVAGKTVSDLPSSSISPLSYIDCADVPDFSLSEVHVDDVFQHIQALDIHKAVGIDEIPTRFVKAAPYGMAVILTKLINMSILTCTFPDLWKTAIDTPVQKSKQNNSLSNFRPISVLPVVSKIWSDLFLMQWLVIYSNMNFFLQNNLVFVLGTLHRMFCYVLLIRGSRQ